MDFGSNRAKLVILLNLDIRNLNQVYVMFQQPFSLFTWDFRYFYMGFPYSIFHIKRSKININFKLLHMNTHQPSLYSPVLQTLQVPSNAIIII